MTLHIPGTLGTGTGAGGEGARFIILLQLGLREHQSNFKPTLKADVPWACNPLTAALADKETVAGASHVLPARRRISDRSGLVTGIAFYYMLLGIRRWLVRRRLVSEFSLTWSFLPEMSIMLLQTLQLTMGTPPARVL